MVSVEPISRLYRPYKRLSVNKLSIFKTIFLVSVLIKYTYIP